VKVAPHTRQTHNPSGESHWASRVRENFKHGSYGEGLETDRKAPRQSLTRQRHSYRAPAQVRRDFLAVQAAA
jgi:hypothetical protein